MGNSQPSQRAQLSLLEQSLLVNQLGIIQPGPANPVYDCWSVHTISLECMLAKGIFDLQFFVFRNTKNKENPENKLGFSFIFVLKNTKTLNFKNKKIFREHQNGVMCFQKMEPNKP